MQRWEWIIPCYEFIQRPKGPLICTVEHLMNRSHLGPESYEVRLSSSLSSRWTVNRGLQWYTERKAHCWGEDLQECLLKRPAEKVFKKIMCISNLFLWANNTPQTHIILCKLACKVKEIETYYSKLRWQSTIPIPYIHAHWHITKEYGWVGALRDQRQLVAGKMIQQLMAETCICFLPVWQSKKE